jgi:hypothetical protein
MALGISRRGEDGELAPVARPGRAEDVSPRVSLRHLDPPAERLRVFDGPLDVLVGMPRSAHRPFPSPVPPGPTTGNPTPLFTIVKQDLRAEEVAG